MRRTALLSLLLLACDPTPTPDAGVDAGPEDAGPPVRSVEPLPDPGPFTAGVARVRIPVPLGIGAIGYQASGDNPTPFADQFPGTTRSHGELDFRAVVLRRGDAFEVIFVRLDLLGVFQQLREAVLIELETRVGRRLDDALILGANHTHSGPGRVLQTNGVLTALADTFDPEFYDRVIDALATVVEQALDNVAPAELGYAMAQSTEGHSDRRCENDQLPQVQEVPDLPVLGIRRGGQLDAIVGSYAYHGTVLGAGDLTLSGDAGGVMEQQIEARFDHPVSVLLFNSWGADMAPGNPPTDPDAVGADQPSDFDRMERVGDAVADAIVPAVEAMVFDDAPEVRTRTYRVPLSTAAIGYPPGTFRYAHGAAFCGLGSDERCDPPMRDEGLASSCIPLTPAVGLPKQSLLTVGQIGPLSLVTAPGEWGTALAAGVLEQVARETSGDTMFIGYANDYTGYSLTEDDWYLGGYEASGALWGPRQGDYLAGRLVDAFRAFHAVLDGPPWHEPPLIAPFSGYEGYALYVPETPVDPGLESDVPSDVGPTDVVTFQVRGLDPWLGRPAVTLEAETDGAFAPVVRSNGTPVDATSYDFWMELEVSPSYEETLRAETRTFVWTVHFPVSHRAQSSIPTLSGVYRFAVELPDGTAFATGSFTVP
ncbi:MAG: neutral/alkaline non-lysosomal ceramidase N-terminal domain-containing protein [Sandaracinaceae bacterium]